MNIFQSQVCDIVSGNTCNQDAGRRCQLSLIGSHCLYVANRHIFKDSNRLLTVFFFAKNTKAGTQTKQHRSTYFVHCDIRDFHITQMGPIYRE